MPYLHRDVGFTQALRDGCIDQPSRALRHIAIDGQAFFFLGKVFGASRAGHAKSGGGFRAVIRSQDLPTRFLSQPRIQ